MAKRRIDIDITANDQASGVFRSVSSNASSMSSKLMGALNSSATAMGRFEKGLKNYNNAMHGVNRVISRVVRVAGDSIYNFTKDAINNFSTLEHQHAKTMGAMATNYDKTADAQRRFLEDSKKLQQQAIELGTSGPTGKGSLYTSDEVSYAQTALIKSGLDADDLLKSGALQSILKFAGGNDLDIDTATRFAVNLGTVFNKPVEEWGTMLDQVTKAADISVIDVEDIMDSLTYTGGIASGLGRDITEVLGIISVMGQAGLRGRVAGTGLQAFFTRILSAGELSDTQVDNAPTEYVGQMYNAFISEAVTDKGKFKSMDEVAVLLDDAMSGLNDQEQAWFAKKLFGLYQMKAAYAITGSVDGDENLIEDFIYKIENESEGTNDAKLNEMLESQYGKIERTKNKWEGTKTDFGARMSPTVEAIVDELFNFLSDPQNYEIDYDGLRTSLSESGDLIAEKYGEELASTIEDIGNIGISATQIAEALTPYAGGLVGGIAKLLNGDIAGAFDELLGGIEDTNDEIDKLPPELQGTANAAHAAFIALTALGTVNLLTTIVRPIMTAINTVLGKPIKAMTAKVTSTTTSVTSTTANVTATNITVGTATTVNIGQVPLMNVTATVVNVFGGGSGNNPTNPTNPTTPQLPTSPTVPQLPGGSGGTLMLPSGSGGLLPGLAIGAGTAGALGSSKVAGYLGSGTSNGAFKWFGSNSAVLNADGSVAARLWNGKTASQIIGSAAKVLGIAGTIAMVASIPSSGVDPDSQYASILNEGIEKGYDNESLRQYLYDNWKSNITDKSEWGNNHREEEKQGVVRTFDAQTEMYTKWMTTEGATEALNAIKTELEEQGTLSEQFLQKLVTNEGSTGGKYTGSQADLEFLFSILFNKEYDRPWMYGGSYADEYSTKFAKDAINNGQLYDLVTLTELDNIKNQITDTTGNIIRSFTDLADRMQSPILNVNVTTNVDKSGNATSKVDITSASRDIARRSSQYGQTHMIN